MKPYKHLIILISLVCLLGMPAACSDGKKISAENPKAVPGDRVVDAVAADTIFIGGKVYTVNEKQPWAEAVAVAGNKIIYVGDSAGVEKFKGDKTRIVDLGGKMLLPGFISGHDHLISANWMGLGVQLYDAKSKEEYQKLIKEYAAAHPDEKFVLGIGWNPKIYGGYPTAKELDELVPDRPAILLEFTVHDAWLNTKAMQMGGVDKNTPDPSPGVSYWQRDKEGNPTGVAIEVAWMPAYVKSGAWDPKTMIPQIQQKAYQIGASTGITSLLNAGIVTPNITGEGQWADYEIAMAYLQDLADKGELSIRTFTMPFYKNEKFDPKEVAAKARAFKDKYHSDMLNSFALKIHPEGNYSSKTSFMLQPYKGTDEVGAAMVVPERVKEVVLAANAQGLDVITHCDGSATTRGMVDAIEAARKAGYTDARNQIHHMFFAHPDDQKRIIEQGMLVNATPMFYVDIWGQKKLVDSLIDDEVRDTQFGMYPTIVRGGGKVSISADVPGGPIDTLAPLINIETAMTQKPATVDDAQVFPPGRQGITLEQAIRAVTIDAAYFIRMEGKVGSIEPGKYADLVVLEKNLFDVTPERISDVKVLATMMNGKYTYKAGESSTPAADVGKPGPKY